MLIIRSRQHDRSNPQRLRHVHADEHELLLVESGRGRQLIGGDEVSCQAGDVFLFPPGSPHNSHCRPGQHFTCLLLFIRGEDLTDGAPGDGGRLLLDHFSALVPSGGQLRLATSTVTRVRQALRRALAEQQCGDHAAACAVRVAASEVFIAIVRDPLLAVAPTKVAREDEIARHVDRASRFLADHADMSLRVVDLLGLGPLGRSSFLAEFKAITGTTVMEALVRHRLERACHLMMTTDESLAAVAVASGFGNHSHFTRTFTRVYGQSPTKWRQMRRSIYSIADPR